MKNELGPLKSPDAIKIMPQPKQDEYRSLKEQIAQLEKKKTERKKGDNFYSTIHCKIPIKACNTNNYP